MEKIKISNFACFSSIEIEIKDFNLFIGPQATGKSILAKLFYFFKGILWIIPAAVEDGATRSAFNKRLMRRFEEMFPRSGWGKKNFCIRYECENLWVEITREHVGRKNPHFSYSSFFSKALIAGKKTFKQADLKFPFHGTNFVKLFLQVDGMKIARRAVYVQTFIPAGRSFFALLQQSIFGFLSSNNALDPFLREFGVRYENLKGTEIFRPEGQRKNEFLFESEQLIQQVVRGRHISVRGRDYLDLFDGRRIELSHCSSGQQEILPLALMLQGTAVLPAEGFGHTIYIEEPEAHLFPTSQRLILELIALCYNFGRKWGMQILITTHSPYVITALNNLLEAGALYKSLPEGKQRKINQIIPRTRAISISEVAAYSLQREDECKNIVDATTGLIQTEMIDEVSTEMAVKFDQLLDLS